MTHFNFWSDVLAPTVFRAYKIVLYSSHAGGNCKGRSQIEQKAHDACVASLS